MIHFWDSVYFEKIESIYKSEYDFTKEEIREFTLEYSRALH